MDRYECHITLNRPKSTIDAKRLFALASEYQMKTSFIAGDPLLGAAKYFYLNGFDTSFDLLKSRMEIVAGILRNEDVVVVREKIEKILYDTKTNYFDCGVSCTACL